MGLPCNCFWLDMEVLGIPLSPRDLKTGWTLGSESHRWDMEVLGIHLSPWDLKTGWTLGSESHRWVMKVLGIPLSPSGLEDRIDIGIYMELPLEGHGSTRDSLVPSGLEDRIEIRI